jgi:alpha-galactosidase
LRSARAIVLPNFVSFRLILSYTLDAFVLPALKFMMKQRWLVGVILLLAVQVVVGENAGSKTHGQKLLAATPPMGWNSYDAYGTTVTEDQVKANAYWMAQNLKRYGWDYVVIDMGWFITNPTPAGNGKDSQYVMDEYGRYTPAVNRFPSAANGAGFKSLADYVHSLGLKFGIHILSGIPRQAVEKNLPIAGSAYHAADAANRSETCPWNPDNYGLDASKPAAQAHYDSIAKLYASWGVDFIKADCIASRPYRGDEIRMLSTALHKVSRPIVLSLSPGAAPIEKIDELRKYAQMWRISDDVWDLWHSTVDYPQGLGDQFPRVAKWAPLSEPGHWPDADMLPVGYLGPSPGWGEPRQTRFTHDEQRTLITLWSVFRSPLMIGGNLTRMDDWTTSLLTNPEVLDVDQHSKDDGMVMSKDSIVVWRSRPERGKSKTWYVAVFNTGEAAHTAHVGWKELNIPTGKYKLRDLWERKELGTADALNAAVPSHGCVLYQLSRK